MFSLTPTLSKGEGAGIVAKNIIYMAKRSIVIFRPRLNKF